jgi:GTPase SAR1 family protein
VLVLIGNKTDLPEERMVSRNEALKLARDYEMLYMETSAKSQENVERAFVWPATNILDKVEGGFIQINREDQAIKVNRENLQKTPEKTCEC